MNCGFVSLSSGQSERYPRYHSLISFLVTKTFMKSFDVNLDYRVRWTPVTRRVYVHVHATIFVDMDTGGVDMDTGVHLVSCPSNSASIDY